MEEGNCIDMAGIALITAEVSSTKGIIREEGV
jgi:hypothetical protein